MGSASRLFTLSTWLIAMAVIGLHLPAAAQEKSLDTQSAPFRTLDGTIVKIEGEVYLVQDLDGKEVRLRVSKETKQLDGPKKAGDKIRAEITKTGHALSIQ